MDNRPIGIFDSGLGGLATVKEILEILPNENIIYFGDTARVPYGTRDNETILKYAREDLNFLKTFNTKVNIIACGTISSIELYELKNNSAVELIGIVEPAVRRAIKLTKNNKIGILGTSYTIRVNKYAKLIRKKRSNTTVVSVACPMFVYLVENGYTQGKVVELVANDYLKPLKNANVDTVILGCTHYIMLESVISSILGPNVSIVNSGACLSGFVKKFLKNKEMLNEQHKLGCVEYYVSDNINAFTKNGGIFLRKEISGKVKKVDIETFSE